MRRSWNITYFLSPWYLVSPQFGNTFLGSGYGSWISFGLRFMVPMIYNCWVLGRPFTFMTRESSGTWKWGPEDFLKRKWCMASRGFVAFFKIFRCQSRVMRVKQCHKPAMTGNGLKFIPPIDGDWVDGLLLFYPHEATVGWLESNAEDSSEEYEPWAIPSWSRLRCAFRAPPSLWLVTVNSW